MPKISTDNFLKKTRFIFTKSIKFKNKGMKIENDPSDRVSTHCTLWQYGLWSFQTGGRRLERFVHKNQHTQRKIIEF